MDVMHYQATFDRETDGRWIAAVESLRVLVYGATREDAYQRAEAAALFALSNLPATGRPLEDSILFEAA